MQLHGQVIGNLSAHGYDNAFGYLNIDNVECTLKRELIKVKPVAHIVIG
ncbi:hypothetical protein SDC9_169822 [bioreactor metagenome]|uniref:Uncharacterized protein n=1 Tax=bioreactor metagenome TaxID=1076179 RepID=A0A645G9G1_9ZZZZ